jgi:hypothetical protein
MEPFTREQLQMKNAPGLNEAYKLAEQHLPEIYKYVIEASKHTTSYTHKLRHFQYHHSAGFDNTVYVTRTCDRLKELFPGCIIEYIESKSAINGNVIERAVRIDWS